MKDKHKGVVLSLLSSASIGACYIISKLLLDYVNVETFNVLWFVCASIIFTLFFIFSKNLKKFNIILKNYGKLAVLGIVASVHTILWTYGVLLAGPTSVAFLVQFSSVFAILLGLVFLHERPSRPEWLGILLAVVGAFLFTYHSGDFMIISTVIILSTAFCQAIVNFLAKVYVRDIDPVSVSGARTFFITLFVPIYTISIGKLQTNISINAIGIAFGGALLGAFGGFILFYKSLSMLEITKATAVRSVDPFFATIFAVVVLSSTPSVNEFIGGSFIVTGIAVLSLSR